MQFPTRLLALTLLLAFIGLSAHALDGDAPGAAEVRLLEMIFTGNIGLAIGLAIAILGIFSFVKGNTAGAIVFVVLGVIITLLPGIYNGVRIIACPIASALGGHCGP